jgi:hypothetical protein
MMIQNHLNPAGYFHAIFEKIFHNLLHVIQVCGFHQHKGFRE